MALAEQRYAGLAAHSTAATHLEILDVILHDHQFVLNQLSRMLFVVESLHYLTLDLLSCVLFFLESFIHLGIG